ncbi:MAG: hypothetical protein ACI4PQ_07190 [Butyricicoccaceae bacterium]
MLYYITRILMALIGVLMVTTVVYIISDDRAKNRHQAAGKPYHPKDGKFWAIVYIVVTVLTFVIGAIIVYFITRPDPYEVTSHYETPTAIEFNYEPSDEKQEAYLYQAAEPDDGALDELKERLRKVTGWSEDYKEDEGYLVLEHSEDEVLLIDEENLHWGISYNYTNVQLSGENLPDEAKAKQCAMEILETCGVDTSTLEFDTFSDTQFEDSVVVRYVSKSEDESKGRYTGQISVRLGTDGELIQITDGRTYCEAVKSVTCRSEKDAAQDTLKNGTSETDGTAYIESAQLDYYYNDETGYLIPVWEYEGKVVANDEEKTESNWYPTICAMK